MRGVGIIQFHTYAHPALTLHDAGTHTPRLQMEAFTSTPLSDLLSLAVGNFANFTFFIFQPFVLFLILIAM